MKPIFRNSMFGFHKDDVFQFITKQNKQFELRVRELNEEKEKLEKSSSEQLLSLQAQLDAVIEKNARRDADFEKMNAAKERVLLLAGEFENVLLSAENCKDSLGQMKSDYEAMQGEVVKAQALREKAEKFDQLSGVLTSILVGSKNSEETENGVGLSETMTACAGLDETSFAALFAKLEELKESFSEIKATLSDDE